MIFAAGRGTRLGPLGARTPKALIQIGGQTMLEHVAGRLVAAGADRLIVNVSHHADQITRFLERTDLRVEVLISPEPERPLETGGGLWNARTLFRGDAPFFLHNVDVISDADLGGLHAAHDRADVIATLAVQERETSRLLLFDQDGLVGRLDARTGSRSEVRPARGPTRALAFAGIHVASPQLLERTTERGVFSIFDTYFRLAAEGERIAAFLLEHTRWFEIGTPERLSAARRALEG
jgi:NDP-sugar pyrophosphorylase family protein